LRVVGLTLSYLLVFALSVGCAYVPTTSLRYNPIATAYDGQARYSVAVLPLEEARGPKHYPGLQGRAFMAYVPLLPYVRIPYERLDESHILHQKNRGSEAAPDEHFTTAFAQEIARDLGESGMFRQVKFAASEADAPDADLFLSGALRSTEFDIYFTSYMLGMAGVLLWFLPIPMGKDKATVSLDLVLRDRAGNTLWSHSSKQQASKMFTMYNSAGESTSSEYRIEIKRYGGNKLGIDGDSLWAYHAEALRAALGDAKESLALHLAEAR